MVLLLILLIITFLRYSRASSHAKRADEIVPSKKPIIFPDGHQS